MYWNATYVFSMDPSPFARTSFWTVSLGLTVLWNASSGVGQTTVQRFLAVPDLKAGRRCILQSNFNSFFKKKTNNSYLSM